jgi:deazaflavin-dependent oxidoreductase (nitroreductase family)
MIKKLWFRFIEVFAANRVGAKIFEWFIPPIDKLLLRRSNGRYSVALGKPIGLLTTTGRKSGLARTLPLLYARHGAEIILVASNYGKTFHPAWYLNLTANPHVKFVYDGQEGTFTARTASPDEHDFYWQKAVEHYRGYNVYQERAGERAIPVVVLTPQK